VRWAQFCFWDSKTGKLEGGQATISDMIIFCIVSWSLKDKQMQKVVCSIEARRDRWEWCLSFIIIMMCIMCFYLIVYFINLNIELFGCLMLFRWLDA
jgi:hypothetical protein